MPSQETPSQDKTNKYDGIEEALDVSSDIVPEEKPEFVETATKERKPKKIMNILVVIYTLLSIKDKRQLMVY